MKKTILISLIVIMMVPLWSNAKKEDSKIIATTSWTAAFADLAGVENPAVLAPYEMQHPSEYELKPSDIQMLGQAEMIIFAGYEVMVSRIKENAGTDSTQLISITTIMNYKTMEESVNKIAQAAGTTETAGQNLAKMKEILESSREQLNEKGLSGNKVMVHVHQQAFAREMGFDVVATFGPGPLSANQIGDLSKVEAHMIIDNWHNPISQPLTEIFPDRAYAELINFPGKDETKSLFDVVEYNVKMLIK